jgi:hypothetical protein
MLLLTPAAELPGVRVVAGPVGPEPMPMTPIDSATMHPFLATGRGHAMVPSMERNLRGHFTKPGSSSRVVRAALPALWMCRPGRNARLGWEETGSDMAVLPARRSGQSLTVLDPSREFEDIYNRMGQR